MVEVPISPDLDLNMAQAEELVAAARYAAMSVECSVIEEATGRIVQWVDPIRSQIDEQAQEGQYIIEGHYNQETEYFPNKILTERPLLWPTETQHIAADGIDSLILPLVTGSTLLFGRPNNDPLIRGEFICQSWLDVEDESVIFVETIPGTYRFWIYPPFPYQKQELSVEVGND